MIYLVVVEDMRDRGFHNGVLVSFSKFETSKRRKIMGIIDKITEDIKMNQGRSTKIETRKALN